MNSVETVVLSQTNINGWADLVLGAIKHLQSLH